MTPTDLADKLTASETDLLAQCEDVISRGLRTFIETGNALADVRDNRLYRIDFSTFEDYCAERWQISRPRAYELMAAAATVSAIADKIEVEPPSNEGQARELAKVPEADRAAVWTKAVEQTEGKPTAAAVKDAHEGRDPAARLRPIDRPVLRPINTGNAPAATAMADPSAASNPAPVPPAPTQLGRPRPEPLDDLDVIDEEQAKRGSNTVATSLAGLWMVLDPNPVAWIAARYRRDAYRFRDLPHVRDALTSDGLRTMAKHLGAIADHLDKTGECL